MHTYLFTDLDDSLFQSYRKKDVTPENNPEQLDSGLAIDISDEEINLTVDWLNQRALCFMTPKQQALLNLFHKAHVIPVTARNLQAFQRIRLKFEYGAILNYGGTIISQNGKEDLYWKHFIQNKLLPYQEQLQDILEKVTNLASENNLAIRSRIIGVSDCNFYTVIKNINPYDDYLPHIYAKSANMVSNINDWCVHYNDNNLAFIPKCLNKAHAVEYFIEKHIRLKYDDFLSIGLGDSLVDIDFMQKCDYALVPANSQIQRKKL